MRVIIFGGTGLLGQSIYDLFKSKRFKCYRSSLKKNSEFKSDLLSKKTISKFIKRIKPNLVINCAGETDVSFCNKDFKSAYKSNVLTVRNIANSLNEVGMNCLFIQISTDQVYESNKKNKSNKENETSISNGYGASKFLGEIESLRYKKTLILRTNFFGKSKSINRHSYTDFIISNLIKKKKIKIPSNVFFNPINIEKLSLIIFELYKKNVTGIFNVGSKNNISKFNFAKKIANKFKLDKRYLSDYKSDYLLQQRPLNTFMNTEKLKNKTKIKIPSIGDGIRML
tara:strand:+ start:3061 stop:3912 length:852 start_codon:yes stop_codon:yes gene_type:complete